MVASLLFALVLLAPEPPPVELKYRFAKGDICVDATERSLQLRLFAGTAITKFHVDSERSLRRTVLEVDDEGEVASERVQVEKFLHVVKEHPEQEAATQPYACHGKNYVWKRKRRGGFGLFDEGGEVTPKHPQLVECLQPWRAARLPSRPVRPGDTWEVSAADFLRAAGQTVPKEVEGKCVFRLESVDGDGVARITFEFGHSQREENGRLLTGKNRGEWRFDTKRGRDLEFSMEGELRVDEGEGGDGSFRFRRVLTWEAGRS